MKVDYLIAAQTEEQFRELRKAMDIFDENYDLTYGGSVPRVFRDEIGDINILPSLKDPSKIVAVEPTDKSNKLEKELITENVIATPEFTVVKINNQRYHIVFEEKE